MRKVKINCVSELEFIKPYREASYETTTARHFGSMADANFKKDFWSELDTVKELNKRAATTKVYMLGKFAFLSSISLTHIIFSLTRKYHVYIELNNGSKFLVDDFHLKIREIVKIEQDSKLCIHGTKIKIPLRVMRVLG